MSRSFKAAPTAPAPLGRYRDKRDFDRSPEPPAKIRRATGARKLPIFVVQKHDARRLHWDFRLEHHGVLLSWAVPKGPSMDMADKRLAVRVEDHPLDYASFEGTIPNGNYGAGTVERWDRGTWTPVGDVDDGLAKGELKFDLTGERLDGRFVLIRLKPRPKDHGENWLLIKERDPEPVHVAASDPMPTAVAPQLAEAVPTAPGGEDWLSEIKLDGYRMIAFKQGERIRLISRNGHDWTKRFPRIADALAHISADQAIVDGEIVAFRPDGVSDFSALQAALAEEKDDTLVFVLFDLLYLDGHDLRAHRLIERKRTLAALTGWSPRIRYSDHVRGDAGEVGLKACAMGLEGVICKQIDAPYRSGRGRTWVKVKCETRGAFLILGFTPPKGRRTGLGALHLGYRDAEGALHYAGGVGTGFNESVLADLAKRLAALPADAPDGLIWTDEPPDKLIQWAKPDLVAEVRYLALSGSGRLRHATFLGLREDKTADEVRVPEVKTSPATPAIRLTHPDKELWPGFTKQALADYWSAVAEAALPGIAHRPLALVRCVDGIDGPHFFQKHRGKGMAETFRERAHDGAPFLAIDDAAGLLGAAQIAAIELHSWGSTEADAGHPDRLVFDLDPGEDVAWPDVIAAALDVRKHLETAGLTSFCRTTGGKGLHVVVPLRPSASWDEARPWARAFAEAVVAVSGDRYIAKLSKAQRRGKILIDWLRNGLGSTAVASLSPRARPGATVATPVAWREVTPKLDPQAFTIATVPARLARHTHSPWDGFDDTSQTLPDLEELG